MALWPGGERDSLRPWTKRDQAILAGRMGFVRLALRSQVPIVPISTVGGPDSMPVLATGRRIASALQLDKVARLKMFPIALQVPWGVSPALLPEIPLPTKIRTAFQEPIVLADDPDLAEDRDYVEAAYERGVREHSVGDGRSSRAGGGCRCSAESTLARFAMALVQRHAEPERRHSDERDHRDDRRRHTAEQHV